jgi:hypothetical protein
MAYRTDDGRIFDNQSEAQTHANKLASDADSAREAHRLGDLHANDQINNMIKWYNAGNLDKIVNDSNIDLHYKYFEYAAIKSIAYGKRGDYENAYSWFNLYLSHMWDEPDELTQIAEATAKEAWEKANGRSMTFDDEAKIRLPLIEYQINYWQNKVNKYGAGYNDHDQKTLDYWRNQRKLYRGKGSSSSSTSSSSGDQRGVFLSIVFGLVCGIGTFLTVKLVFNLLSGNGVNIITIIAMIVGFIITFIAWRYKRNVLFGLMLVISVIGYLNLFGIIGNKTPKAKTETTQSLAITQQADIINNVNFRKDPSTGDNIIRQLKKGDTVTLTGETVEGWTQITHNGDTGWVSSEFLKVWGDK